MKETSKPFMIICMHGTIRVITIICGEIRLGNYTRENPLFTDVPRKVPIITRGLIPC